MRVSQTTARRAPAVGASFEVDGRKVGEVTEVSPPWDKPMGGPSNSSTIMVRTVVVELSEVPTTPYLPEALAAWGKKYGIDGYVGGLYMRLFA